MPSLMDIGPSTEVVKVRGVEIEVLGISAEGLLGLFGRFPELRKLIGGFGNMDEIFKVGGPLIAAIIAAGTGSAGNKEAEKKAASLSLGDQAALFRAVWKATFPNGLTDLLEFLGEMGLVDPAAAASVTESASTSLPVSKS